MPKPKFEGPLPLTAEQINAVVTRKSPGNFALDKTNDQGRFLVAYVGRDDTDLNKRLHALVGRYKRFIALCADSPKEAFDKECEIYHYFYPPDNGMHPDRPEGTDWKCPRCNIFE